MKTLPKDLSPLLKANSKNQRILTPQIIKLFPLMKITPKILMTKPKIITLMSKTAMKA